MKEDIEQLSRYESYFYSAIHADYIRALWDSDMKLLISIYEKWVGKKYTGCITCGKAKLDFMKRLGELYFKNKEEIKNIEYAKEMESRSKGENKICSGVNSSGPQQKSRKRKAM